MIDDRTKDCRQFGSFPFRAVGMPASAGSLHVVKRVGRCYDFLALRVFFPMLFYYYSTLLRFFQSFFGRYSILLRALFTFFSGYPFLSFPVFCLSLLDVFSFPYGCCGEMMA